MPSTLYIVGTPIGNLDDMTLRGLSTLKLVDVIYCEDTRRSLKLLNHFEIRKPLKSAPYFRERDAAEKIIAHLAGGESVALITDAGMPGVSDPGSLVVGAVRKAGYKVEIIGGVSALTHFIAGLGRPLESFSFIGFLPPRTKDREKIFKDGIHQPLIFFESPHRIQSTLELLAEIEPNLQMSLGKELSKISEAFFDGTASEVLKQIRSTKGEWVGCLWPKGG